MYGQFTWQIWDPSEWLFLRYRVYKVLTFLPLVTPINLWPPPKTIEIIYSIWPTHILSMRYLRVTLLEISCLQGFDRLTSGDPKWPLTSTKNNRDHLLNMGNSHGKYEIPHIYPSGDTVFTSNFQGVYHLTSGDPKWPLTFTKNNRDHLLNKGYLHVKYEIHWVYRSWVRDFTSQASHTHIHTYIHTHIHTHKNTHTHTHTYKRTQSTHTWWAQSLL